MSHAILVRGKQSFVVKYDRGAESAALDQLVAWANDPQMAFDWFDAAVMAHQIGRELGEELKGMAG